MKWKLFFSLLIIASLLIFLQTQKEFIKIRLPEAFYQTIGKFHEIIKGFLTPPAEKFLTFLELEESSFFGQEIELFNASFTGNGICKGEIKLNKILIGKDGKCSIKAKVKNGKLTFLNGILELKAELSSLDLDETSYRGETLNIELRIDPKTIFVGVFSKKIMIIENANGEVKKLKEDGTLDQLKILSNEKIIIENFVGNIVFKEGKVRLGGEASLIKGEKFEFRV